MCHPDPRRGTPVARQPAPAEPHHIAQPIDADRRDFEPVGAGSDDDRAMPRRIALDADTAPERARPCKPRSADGAQKPPLADAFAGMDPRRCRSQNDADERIMAAAAHHRRPDQLAVARRVENRVAPRLAVQRPRQPVHRATRQDEALAVPAVRRLGRRVDRAVAAADQQRVGAHRIELNGIGRCIGGKVARSGNGDAARVQQRGQPADHRGVGRSRAGVHHHPDAAKWLGGWHGCAMPPGRYGSFATAVSDRSAPSGDRPRLRPRRRPTAATRYNPPRDRHDRPTRAPWRSCPRHAV